MTSKVLTRKTSNFKPFSLNERNLRKREKKMPTAVFEKGKKRRKGSKKMVLKYCNGSTTDIPHFTHYEEKQASLARNKTRQKVSQRPAGLTKL